MDDVDDEVQQRPTRHFDNGTMWVRVFEEADPTSPSGRILVFETDYGRKEAEVYPTDWAKLTSAELRDFALRHAD